MPLTPQEQERLAYTHGGPEAELWRLMCEALEWANAVEALVPACGYSTRESELGEEIDELNDRIGFLENALHDAELELLALKS